MATHSSILAWKIPQRSLVGYSQPMGSQRDMTKRLSTRARAHTHTQSQPLGGCCAVPNQVLNGYHIAQSR